MTRTELSKLQVSLDTIRNQFWINLDLFQDYFTSYSLCVCELIFMFILMRLRNEPYRLCFIPVV